MIIFDRDGNFLRSWGEGIFPRAHGLHIAPDDTIWCTDDGDHTVRQCTMDGKVLLTIGQPGKPMTEKDSLNPLSLYGRTKAEAEAAVTRLHTAFAFAESPPAVSQLIVDFL